MRLVSEQQHIEYQFSGLEDNHGEDAGDDGDNDNYANEDGELSFDYRPNKHAPDVLTSRNSMEVRISDLQELVTFRGQRKVIDCEANSFNQHPNINLLRWRGNVTSFLIDANE